MVQIGPSGFRVGPTVISGFLGPLQQRQVLHSTPPAIDRRVGRATDGRLRRRQHSQSFIRKLSEFVCETFLESQLKASPNERTQPDNIVECSLNSTHSKPGWTKKLSRTVFAVLFGACGFSNSSISALDLARFFPDAG